MLPHIKNSHSISQVGFSVVILKYAFQDQIKTLKTPYKLIHLIVSLYADRQ